MEPKLVPARFHQDRHHFWLSETFINSTTNPTNLIDFVHSCSKSGVPVDIGQAAFRTSLKLLSNSIFSVNSIDPSSNMAQEIKESVRDWIEKAGKNLADYFPVLGKFDLQGIRSSMEIHLGKLFGFMDSMINKQLEMIKFRGYIKTNDVLDTLLSISEDDNDEIDPVHIQTLQYSIIKFTSE
ncbi:geraniol 8-hydroxylase-like [Cornus florida]|uniref:geraniol 8-hydroxylase-like n=1 Tax=Cornus florida TaxID=4283 RepID=UPI002898FF1F|nr:geraniol 8-hydroxylase-like [Cornus florida]